MAKKKPTAKIPQKKKNKQPGRVSQAKEDTTIVSASPAPCAPGIPGTNSRSFFQRHRLLLVVLLVAAIFRLAFFIEKKNDPEFRHANVDAMYHEYWAEGIVTGQWHPPHDLVNPHIESNPYFRPPGYPYYLSLVYRVFGKSTLLPRILQLLLGIFSCGLLFLLTREIFNEQIAFISGLLMAVYWAFPFFEKELREVSLLVFTLPLLLLCLIKIVKRPKTWKLIGCGLLMGYIIITRPNFLLFFPVAVIWLYFRLESLNKRKKILFTSIFLLCTLIPIASVTVRNAVTGKDFVLISSNGGINLYVGNNPHATGNTIALPPEIPLFRNAFMYPQIVEYIEKVEGKKIKHSQASTYFTGKALEYIKENPGRTIAMMLKKAAMFIGGVEIPSERDLTAERQRSRVLNILPLNFAFIFSLALVGIVLFFTTSRQKANQTAILVLLLVGVYYLSYLPFFVTSRFRMSIIPFLIIFAGLTVVTIYRYFTAKQIKKAVVLLFIVIAVFLLDSVNYFGFKRDLGKAEFDRALAFQRAKNNTAAIAGYLKAVKIKPDYPDAYNNLGNLYRETGKTAVAIENYLKAIHYAPDHYFANLNLGQIYHTASEWDKAATYYERALAIRPSEYLYNILSNTYFKNNKLKEAKDLLGRAMTAYGRKAQFLNNLGILYVFEKNMVMAEKTFLEITNQYPGDVQARVNLGRLYFSQNLPGKAKEQFEKALVLEPGNKTANEFLQKLK